ncbi:MAG: hypothetical protein ACRERC_06195 [Candidatus Binatia bacterium]
MCRSCLQSGRGGGERWWFLRGALLCTAVILALLGGLILLTR